MTVAGLNEVYRNFGDINVGKFFMEQSLPFLVEEEHEGCAAGRGVIWAKGHDVEGEE